jgi:molecular chaperone GrpE
MTGPGDTRPGGSPVTDLRDRRRRDPGAVEPRRRADVEPAPGGDGLRAFGRDRRRGAPGPPGAPGAAEPVPDEAEALRERLREQAEALRRVQAEYDNYRKRVRRDRLAVGRTAVANVLGGLLPVLDAIGQARAQGEVTGGFGRVVEVLEGELAALGLESFGEPGDPFDPTVHEAVLCTRTNRVTRPTCTTILRPGYRVADRLLRPAQAEVAEPPTAP